MCVAMVAGRRGGTSEHDLRAGLVTLGYGLGDFVAHRTARVPIADVPALPTLETVALARLRAVNGIGYHWVLIHGGQVFDPLFAGPVPIRWYEALNHARTHYVASYAIVYRAGAKA